MSRPTISQKDTVLYWVIRLYASDGTLVDADSNPTIAVRKNGAATAEAPTVTKRAATTGIYDCYVDVTGESEGDCFTIEETAVISLVPYENSWAFDVIVAMRGTDGANTVAPANGDITSIKAKTDSLTFTGNDVNANVQAGSSDATAANQVAIQNAIAALNDFDPSADTVAQVTDVALVAVCTTNTDMRGTNSANTVAPDNAGITANGLAVAALNDFDPATQAIANVTNVATTAVCVSNADMRGTDSANTVVPDNAGIAANGTALAATTKTGIQYTATAQSGDTIQVTLS